MEANELRIGNLLIFSNNIERIVSILDIDINGEGPYVNGELLYEPIPLSEEWLTKFGFEKVLTAFAEFWHYKKIRISQNDKFVGEDTWLCMLIGNNIGTNIKYVHELQNIYFSLTSQELELTNT